MTVGEFKILSREVNAKRKATSFFDTALKHMYKRRIITTGELIHGCYFITSEQLSGNPRFYTIRKANIKTGEVTTIVGFQNFKTPREVIDYLRLRA